jgi:hydroxymethylglutaryl-CoA lyase
MLKSVKIIETPRDAWQGLHYHIPTDRKVEMINALLKVGFDILEVGSFVSKKLIPQTADTGKILDQINPTLSQTKVMVLCGNAFGAKTAVSYDNIDYLSYPFSISETFLKKNINAGFDKAWENLVQIKDIADRTNKKTVVYLTMAFGNPYNDPVDIEIINHWVDRLDQVDIKTISLSDIIGVAEPGFIANVYSLLSAKYPNIEFGIHLHIKNNEWYDKLDAALQNGCKMVDGAITGMGGCPMTGYELLGNLPTGRIIEYLTKNRMTTKVSQPDFFKAQKIAKEILQPNNP